MSPRVLALVFGRLDLLTAVALHIFAVALSQPAVPAQLSPAVADPQTIGDLLIPITTDALLAGDLFPVSVELFQAESARTAALAISF